MMPDQTTEYRLRALNEKGQYVDKTVTVIVRPPKVPIAGVEFLTIKAATIYVGEKYRLKWRTTYARAVHIDSSDPGITIGDVSPGDGSQEVTFTTTNPVTFTLTASDSANLATTKTYIANPKEKPVPPAAPVTTPDPVRLPTGTPGGTAAPPP